MCTHQTLSYDSTYGYIISCTRCNHLQLAFGCMLINFRREEFRGFQKVINEIMEDFRDCMESAVKTITIPTPCEGLAMFLSPMEIGILQRIVEEADSNLRANELIALLNDPV